uniref:Uncharacterized protein n=1 Tax=Clytia hemisphaerica TaxID=252671 RepID=A0A7M5V766_9CNID|eukprot:TCONS_00063604-protein
MTYSCGELIDDDVETLEYCPRSFIEENPDEMNKPEKITPKRGSFTELRNTILTKVSTPRGNRRSKTLIQRCESAGKGLKDKLGRTSSVDVLGNPLRKPQQKHHKSLEEDFMFTGFSQLADKTLVTRSKVAEVRRTSADNATYEEEKRRELLNRMKDRSMSCPSYPTIKEEEIKVVKSSSYDSSNYKQTDSDKLNIEYPTIKIELCKNESLGPKSAPLQRKNSKWSDKSASMSSLSSTKTNGSNGYLSSDNSSVFNSETSINGGRDEMPMHRRPVSFIDIFKRDNIDEFSAPSHNHTYTLPRGLPRNTTDCNCNTLQKNGELSSSETDLDHARTVRGRASSMIEIGANKNTSMSQPKTQRRHEQLKKTTSNIYGLASPAALKKLFKKKRRSMPSDTRKAPATPVLAEGQRRCIHIESFV